MEHVDGVHAWMYGDSSAVGHGWGFMVQKDSHSSQGSLCLPYSGIPWYPCPQVEHANELEAQQQAQSPLAST